MKAMCVMLTLKRSGVLVVEREEGKRNRGSTSFIKVAK